MRQQMAHADRRSLAGGAVVETRLCARLLGIKLLVVDGTVTLVPGRPAAPDDQVVVPVTWTEVEPRPVPALAPANGAARMASSEVGDRLDSCTQRLEASARRLQELSARSEG
jgi:hypothetical protein